MKRWMHEKVNAYWEQSRNTSFLINADTGEVVGTITNDGDDYYFACAYLGLSETCSGFKRREDAEQFIYDLTGFVAD